MKPLEARKFYVFPLSLAVAAYFALGEIIGLVSIRVRNNQNGVHGMVSSSGATNIR